MTTHECDVDGCGQSAENVAYDAESETVVAQHCGDHRAEYRQAVEREGFGHEM